MNEYYPDRILKIPNATPETNDAAQYMFYKGRKQYNLCGEFCVAYCMQDDANTDTINDFLDYWEAKEQKWYKTLFQNGLSRTTGIPDLKKMLDCYNAFYVDPKGLSNLETVARQLDSYQLIIGVRIDYTGYLVGQGINHWVVVESITPAAGNSANVVIYNPYLNAMQPFGWRELMTSTGASKNGLLIAR